MDLGRDRLETRELAYFVAVAEELHFGRAAQRLGIAQPPLSRAITRMERRVGVPLLIRTTRRVSLTAAGEMLLIQSRAVLQALDRVVDQAKQAAHSQLRLAAAPGAGSALLSALVSAYRSTENPATVELVPTHDPASAVRLGHAEMALVCGTVDTSGLRTMEVTVERPIALLPAGHPLATEARVGLSRLRQEKNYSGQCPSRSLDELIDMVAVGQLIVVVGEGAALRAGPSVAAVPVYDLAPTTLALAWKRDTVIPRTVEAFLGSAQRHVMRPAGTNRNVRAPAMSMVIGRPS